MAGLALLGGCGSNVTPAGNSTTVATPVAQITTPSPTPLPSASAAPAAPDWAGNYDTRFDGGEGDLTIAATETPGHYKFDVDVGAQGCAGQASGDGMAKGDTLILTAKGNEDGVCTLTVQREGKKIEMAEDETGHCLYFHGAACSFTGTVKRR
jgi:hypothetical protein